MNPIFNDVPYTSCPTILYRYSTAETAQRTVIEPQTPDTVSIYPHLQSSTNMLTGACLRCFAAPASIIRPFVPVLCNQYQPQEPIRPDCPTTPPSIAISGGDSHPHHNPLTTLPTTISHVSMKQIVIISIYKYV